MEFVETPQRSETTASIKEKLGISGGGSAVEFLNEQGNFVAVATQDKTILEIINEIDMTAPSGGACLLFLDNPLWAGDYANKSSYLSGDITPTFANNGRAKYKVYDSDNNIIETSYFTSGLQKTFSFDKYDGQQTVYGKIVKITVEPENISDNITKLVANSKSTLAVVFDVNITTLTTMSSVFSGAANLTKAILPTTLDSVTSMANSFENCYNLTSLTLPTSMTALTSLASAFINCYSISSITLPTTIGAIASMTKCFQNCNSLTSVTIPASITTITDLSTVFANCYSLTSVTLPTTLNSVTTMASVFSKCYSLTSITMPTSMTALTDLASAFSNCYSLTSVTLPTTLNSVTTMASAFNNCYNLTSVTMPTSMTALTNLSSAFYNCYSLSTQSEIISYTASQVNATDMHAYAKSLTTFKQLFKASKFTLSGVANQLNTATSIDIDWAGSTYGGASPQIDIRFNSLDATELNRIFTAIANFTGKTINVAGNSGAATCDTSIITGKGGTVITA